MPDMLPHPQPPSSAHETARASSTELFSVQDTRHNEFVIGLLTDLQHRRYSPAAWGHFLADSWQKSWTTSKAHPRLTRSWMRVSALVIALATGAFAAIWLIEGQQIALRLLPMLLICLVLQQGDVYVHLGLNWHPLSGRFREQLGLPTTLTLVRGVLANLLLAHLLSGLIPLPGLTLAVYLLGIATDIADGQIARRTGWQTRLGGNLDGEADLLLYSSATLCALLAGLLPGWFAAIILLRFAMPLIGALISYFVAIRQVDFNHTAWGRSAGVAQSIVLIIALAPQSLAHLFAPLYPPLLLVTGALMALAPSMEIRKNLRFWRFQQQEIKR